MYEKLLKFRQLHSSLDLTNLNLMKYHDLVNKSSSLKLLYYSRFIQFSKLHGLVNKSGLMGLVH